MKTQHVLEISRGTARKIRRVEKTGLWTGRSSIRRQLDISINRICTALLDAYEETAPKKKKAKKARKARP